MQSLKLVSACLLWACVSLAQAAKAPPQYQDSCALCHAAGRFGAPRAGVPGDWAARLKQGMPVLVAHVKGGYNAMPATGMCGGCSDQDYRALIKYMSDNEKKDKP